MNIKQQVYAIADKLPENATWEDVRYQVELRRSIERGVADSDAGRTVPHEEVLREFGIVE
jgi:predicted transcriptional regulator